MKKNSRFSRGWRLTKDSWAVIKADRSLLAFPVVGSVAAIVAFAIIAVPGVAAWAASDQWWTALPFAALALYAATFVTIYMGVGLAAAAAQVMEGNDATLKTGLAVSNQHLGSIAKWALVQATVGLIINALQQMAESENGLLRIVGLIFTMLISVAWSLASFFVIPLLAFEDLGPKDALTRSVSIIKGQWGESVVGSASIGGIIGLLGILPSIVLIVCGVGVGGPVGIAMIVVGAIVLVIAAVLVNTLSQVFRVALYRYATGVPQTPGFASDDLAGAFRPKKSRGRGTSAAGLS
jgi:hypothetical protein